METKLNVHNFSLFTGGIKNVYPAQTLDLGEVLQRIVNPKLYQRSTEALRMLDVDAQKQAKKDLDYCTFSGVFSKRNNSSIETYSGLICVDIDHVESPEALKQVLIDNEDLPVKLAFTSPSGKGLKVVLATDGIAENHLNWYYTYETYFKDNYGIKIDKACKDIARACFLCYDPNAYCSTTVSPTLPPMLTYQVKRETKDKSEKKEGGATPPLTNDTQATTKDRARNTMKLWQFKLLVRKYGWRVCDDYSTWFSFVSACSKGCGEQGRMQCDEICRFSLHYDAKHQQELYTTQMNNPENTYTFATAVMIMQQFGFATGKKKSTITKGDVISLRQTVEKLPYPLCQYATEENNAMVAKVYGCIAGLSAVMPKCYFIHDKHKYYFNIYIMVLGELASGKGSASDGAKWIAPMDEYLRSLVDDEKKLQYCIVEAGNITDAMLIYDLNYNQDNINSGSMLIYTPEIDILCGSRTKIGLSSDNTRLAWGHESIMMKRKGMDSKSREEDRKGYNVREPRISILSTGTPEQAPRYFKNNTDGNLSRFIIVKLDEVKTWKSGMNADDHDEETIFDKYAEYLKQMWLNHLMIEPAEFTFTEYQKAKLDDYCAVLKQAFAVDNDKFHNYINRIPVAVRRVAGILTTIRLWYKGKQPEKTQLCHDDDWDSAIQLVNFSIGTLYDVYSDPALNLPENPKASTIETILDTMPECFTRDALETAFIEKGYARNSVKNYIAKGLKDRLIARGSTKSVFKKVA